jgi:hypothetical protein
MRLLAFTFLAIAIAAGVQVGLGKVPSSMAVAMHGIIAASIFVLPMIATAGLAYAMRISNFLYAFFAVILSPFVSFAILVYVGVTFLHDHLL